MTHDLKLRRLPLFQLYPPPLPPPVFTNWLQALVIPPPKKKKNSLMVTSSLLSEPGPLDSAQRPCCLSVNQGCKTERGPSWLLFSPTEWHYWNPSPGCVHVLKQWAHTCPLSTPAGEDKIEGERERNVLMHYQTSCFHWTVCKIALDLNCRLDYNNKSDNILKSVFKLNCCTLQSN